MDILTIGTLLAHSCSNPVDDEYDEYVIDLHCVRFTVVAKLLGKEQYVIRSWKVEDN